MYNGDVINVLITSAGRRTSLLRAFLDTKKEYNVNVFAGDVDPLAPALYLADSSIQFIKVTDPAYIEYLRQIVREKRIKLIVPTIDTELHVLSRSADGFMADGCRVLISDPPMIECCSDKWSTYLTMKEHGVLVPRSWLPNDISSEDLPERLFIKPRDGSASKHSYRIRFDRLEAFLKIVPNPIIQEEVAGREITIDALLDFDCRPIHYVPRVRIKTVGGESVQGATIKSEALHLWLMNLFDIIGRLGARGPMTIQAFENENGYVLTEINPRFGGGFPLGYAAGARYPQWIIKMLSGERLSPRLGEYRHPLYMTRYYVEEILETPLW